MVAEVTELIRLRLLHARPALAEVAGQRLQRRADLLIDRQPVERRQDRHPVVREASMARRAHRQVPPGLLARLRAGEEAENEGQIGRATRQRPQYAEASGRIRARRAGEVTAPGDGRLAGAVTVDATEGGGHTDRPGHVAAEFQRRQPGGDRGGTAAGAATRRSPVIPGIDGTAEDRVARLPVAGPGWHVRLAHDHRARRTDAGDDRRIRRRAPPGERRDTGGTAQAGDVDRILDRQRQTQERAIIAARPRGIGGSRGRARGIVVGGDNGVEGRVVALDLVQVQVEQLNCGDLARAESMEHRGGGRELIESNGGHAGLLRRAASGWWLTERRCAVSGEACIFLAGCDAPRRCSFSHPQSASWPVTAQ